MIDAVIELLKGNYDTEVWKRNKMDDLIYRQYAIDALNKKRIETMEKGQDVNLIWECLDAVAKVPSAQQWIPCSERLPEEDGRYLCTFQDIFYGEKNFVDFGVFDDGQWIVEPLAWMPLPQPWGDMDGEG